MKKDNKSPIKMIVIVIAVILVLFLTFNLFTKKNIKINVDNSNINFTYSSLDYKKIEENQNEVKLESKENEIITRAYNNIDTKYDVLKEYKKMVYNGEEKQYKNVKFLSYNENENKHVYMAQISENSYVEIIFSKKENSSKSLEDIVNQKNVQKILDSVKITK
ncbi:MAG: hypothetical protein IJH39_10755 [Clostridia bacterium]|nr:hypothetical protein [Clostridia bacterium]